MFRYWLVFAIVVLVTGKETNGQSHHIGLSGGVNYSTLNSLNDNDFTDLWQIGPSHGLIFEARFTKYFFLETGLMYNKRGAGVTVGMSNGESPVVDQRVLIEYNHYYLSIPIAVGMRTGNRVAPFTQFGTVFSRILKSYNNYPPLRAGDDIGDRNTKDSHAPFDFAMMLRVGVIAGITNRLEGSVSATFEHSIFGLTTYSGNQHMGFLGHVGLKYRLGKSLE
jgi:hypothetical protein